MQMSMQRSKGSQASILAAFLAAGTGGQWQRIADAAAASPGNALLILDRGYGRGNPGAVILAADPGTRLWIVDLDRLRLEEAGIAAERYRELHVALSNRTVAKNGRDVKELAAFPLFRHFSERPSDIPYYRHFVRNDPEGRPRRETVGSGMPDTDSNASRR